jgi:TolB protein
VLASSLFCNFPPFRSTTGGVEPTFAAIMTEAINVPTTTSTPQANEITPPVAVGSVTPIPVGGTPFFPTMSETPGSPISPSSGKIVFSCYLDSFDQICSMNSDGSGFTRLTTTEATDFYSSLSPNGKEIVFSSRRDGPFQIYSMNLDGSNQHRLTKGLGNLYAPEISPDGKSIAFTVETGNTQNIWVMDRDGSNPRNLTQSKLDNIDPTWSPDGNQIAYSSSQTGTPQLWVMNKDGSGSHQVTNLPNMGGRSSWSPDGKNLAFYAGPKGDHNIFTIGVDGQGLRQLTQGGDNLGPCYSPDGAWITFNSFRDFNNEIYIMRFDGSEQTNLTHAKRPDWQPRWGREP